MIDKNSLKEDMAQIKQVLSGDKEAFSLLVTKYKNQIFSIISSQVADSVASNDLAQETFIRAYKYLKSFKGESSFLTWLTKIALNNIKTYYSSNAYKQSKHQESFDVKDHDVPDDSAQIEEKKEAMRVAMLKLNEKNREILSLKFFDGLSYQEISQVLQIPMGTVASRLNSALLALRNQLKEVC